MKHQGSNPPQLHKAQPQPHLPIPHATAPSTTLPVLTNRYPGFARLHSAADAAVLVEVVSPVPQAVQVIEKSTPAFQ